VTRRGLPKGLVHMTTRQKLIKLGAASGLEPRTWARYTEGKPCRRETVERIEQALLDPGLRELAASGFGDLDRCPAEQLLQAHARAIHALRREAPPLGCPNVLSRRAFGRSDGTP
jgi:hypothetical protein